MLWQTINFVLCNYTIILQYISNYEEIHMKRLCSWLWQETTKITWIMKCVCLTFPLEKSYFCSNVNVCFKHCNFMFLYDNTQNKIISLQSSLINYKEHIRYLCLRLDFPPHRVLSLTFPDTFSVLLSWRLLYDHHFVRFLDRNL